MFKWRAVVVLAVLVAASQGMAQSVVPPDSLTLADTLLRLLSVVVLIALNAFFVATEFSIVSVRRSRIQQLVEAGDASARIVQNLQTKLDRLLSATQLGITLSSLALGWIGEKTVAATLAVAIAYLPLSQENNEAIAHAIAIPVGFLLLAYVQIVFGELCPKSVALLHAEQLARGLAPLSGAIARLFNPFLWILNQSTQLLLRLLGIRYPSQSWHSRITPEELRLIVATERESIGLEAEEREILGNVFRFGDVTAEEIMVPRTRIQALPRAATFKMLLQEVARSGHSRYPVTGESLDDVQGIIDFKEVAATIAEGLLALDTPIEPWMRPARFVTESTPLSELLPMIQRRRSRSGSRSYPEMAIVVDEFGGTAGLFTVSDLIVAMVGDRAEPEDSEELEVRTIREGTFQVQAQMRLEDANELLDLDLPLMEEYQTLGGFIIHHLQKIPSVGETLQYEHLEFTVADAEGPRLHQIVIRRLEETDASDRDSSSMPTSGAIAAVESMDTPSPETFPFTEEIEDRNFEEE